MEFTPAMQQAMKKAMQLAHACQSAYIGTEHLLAALMQNTDSYASHVLKKRGVSAEKIEQELQRVTHSDPTSSLETQKSACTEKRHCRKAKSYVPYYTVQRRKLEALHSVWAASTCYLPCCQIPPVLPHDI